MLQKPSDKKVQLQRASRGNDIPSYCSIGEVSPIEERHSLHEAQDNKETTINLVDDLPLFFEGVDFVLIVIVLGQAIFLECLDELRGILNLEFLAFSNGGHCGIAARKEGCVLVTGKRSIRVEDEDAAASYSRGWCFIPDKNKAQVASLGMRENLKRYCRSIAIRNVGVWGFIY